MTIPTRPHDESRDWITTAEQQSFPRQDATGPAPVPVLHSPAADNEIEYHTAFVFGVCAVIYTITTPYSLLDTVLMLVGAALTASHFHMWAPVPRFVTKLFAIAGAGGLIASTLNHYYGRPPPE